MRVPTFRRSGASMREVVAPRNAGEREGFALPMTILIIAFLTVTIAAAYAATSSEVTTNAAQRGESKAYMIAQAGLESFMARRNEDGFCPTIARTGQTTAPCGFPPKVVTESTTVALPGGYAEITVQRIRVASDARPAIYLMRSRGVDTSSKAITGSSTAVRGERTVAQLVYWNVNQVQVLSGWTSASGLDKTGSSGTISGYDNNTGSSPNCPGTQPTVAGIAVPTGDYSATGNFNPQGTPPIQYLGTQAQTNAAIKIDWNGIVNGDRIQPDFTFNSSAQANTMWPNMSSASYYPTIRVDGDLNLSNTNSGHGTLIVTGNLTLNGNGQWRGIILVGGQMTSNGNNTMLGATMSGLNSVLTAAQLASAQTLAPGSTLSNTPGPAIANGTKTFQYDSCEVAKAASGLASYSVYPNAWMDNFVTY